MITPRRWLFLSALALLAAALIGPRVVPLYDGVGFPDQPYQFVGSSNPPSPVEQTVPKQDLASYSTTIQSLESGPQVRVLFDAGAVTLPAGASEADLKVTPEAPSAQPASGTIAGNVYLVAVTSSPGPPKINNAGGSVFLRLPQATSFRMPPVVVYRPAGGQWKQVQTGQTGADIYRGDFSGPGEYALAINAQVPATPASGPAAGASHASGPVLAGAAIGLIVIILLIIRFVSARAHRRPRP